MNDEIKKELLRPIPAEHIDRKQGKLDYVRGGWVKARMNEIFGPDGWSWEIVSWQVRETAKGVAVCAHGRLKVGDTTRDALAAGTGQGFDGLHQAMGEADTDAFKRAAATLGIQLGLMLYLAQEDERRIEKTPLPDGTLAKMVDAINGASDRPKLFNVMKQVETRLRSHEVTQEQKEALTNAESEAKARMSAEKAA